MNRASRSSGAAIVPDHLPRRLAIAFWGWSWATDCQPGEMFHDLDAAFRGLIERGFNTVRVDALWSWAFDREGRRRGPIELAGLAEPGYANLIPGFGAGGGGRFDALDRLLHLLDVATRYGVNVALTSWEYQPGHSAGFLADPALRADVIGVSPDARYPHLAAQCDRLISEIKRQGLEKCIAYVEVHNEADYSAMRDLPGGLAAGRAATEKALAFLRGRHPDLLFTDDYQVDVHTDGIFDYNTALRCLDKYAANAQLLDHHLYCGGGVQGALIKAVGLQQWPTLTDAEITRLASENELYAWLLRPGSPTYIEYKQHFKSDWFKSWWPLIYLFQNMDVDRYDYWMFCHYPEWEERMRTFWRNYIQVLGQHARQRNLPIVCDEGYLFWPPMHSRFEPSAVGRSNFEFIVDHMLQEDYWGIMVSTYTLPDQPLCTTEAAWLKKINEHILSA